MTRKRDNGKATWFLMKGGLEHHHATFVIATDCQISTDAVLSRLYRVAGWFSEQGKYGVVNAEPDIVDLCVATPGLGVALIKVGWMKSEHGQLVLRGFTNVSAIRKVIGTKLRRKVLSGAFCAACRAVEGLVIDHVIPVSRGGGSEEENLQALCVSCNTAKGTKTMVEFMEGRLRG